MEERKQSRYVKLTKDNVSMEDITPGELNQPIEVPQVSIPFIPILPFFFLIEFSFINGDFYLDAGFIHTHLAFLFFFNFIDEW